MGNKSTKKSIPLKEEKEKEKDKTNGNIITQETPKNTSKPGSLENALKEKEKEQEQEQEQNIPNNYHRKLENDEISQLEAISKELKEKNIIQTNENTNSNLNNKNNNNNINDNNINLIQNNLQNEYIVDINKYHKKRNGKKVKVQKNSKILYKNQSIHGIILLQKYYKNKFRKCQIFILLL